MYLVVGCIGSDCFQGRSGKVTNLNDYFQYALNLYEDGYRFKSSNVDISNSMEIV